MYGKCAQVSCFLQILLQQVQQIMFSGFFDGQQCAGGEVVRFIFWYTHGHQTETRVFDKTVLDPPQSGSTRTTWATLQRQRQQQRHISTTSPSTTHTTTSQTQTYRWTWVEGVALYARTFHRQQQRQQVLRCRWRPSLELPLPRPPDLCREASSALTTLDTTTTRSGLTSGWLSWLWFFKLFFLGFTSDTGVWSSCSTTIGRPSGKDHLTSSTTEWWWLTDLSGSWMKPNSLSHFLIKTLAWSNKVLSCSFCVDTSFVLKLWQKGQWAVWDPIGQAGRQVERQHWG